MSQELPNRVRKAMRQSAAEDHPAPELLNAYAEHVLTRAEEQKVLAHLSKCDECREVLYLASSTVEDEPAPAPAALPKRMHWWTWAIPAAAALAVVSLVLVLRIPSLRESQPKTQQIAQAKQNEVAPASNASTGVSEAASPSVVKSKENGIATSRVRSETAAPRRSRDGDEAEKKHSAKKEPAPMARDRVALAPPRQEIEPSLVPSRPEERPEQVTVEAEAPLVATPESINRLDDARTGGSAKGLLSQAQTSAVAKAAPANAGAYAGNVPSKQYEVMAKRAAVAPTWMVAPDGVLLHRVKGEWQRVVVNHARFTVLASVGNSIWAGGERLTLYHSGNDGSTWERQVVPDARSAGNIVQLHFKSAVEGSLQTDSGDRFITQDGGKHWVVQAN